MRLYLASAHGLLAQAIRDGKGSVLVGGGHRARVDLRDFRHIALQAGASPIALSSESWVCSDATPKRAAFVTPVGARSFTASSGRIIVEELRAAIEGVRHLAPHRQGSLIHVFIDNCVAQAYLNGTPAKCGSDH